MNNLPRMSKEEFYEACAENFHNKFDAGEVVEFVYDNGSDMCGWPKISKKTMFECMEYYMTTTEQENFKKYAGQALFGKQGEVKAVDYFKDIVCKYVCSVEWLAY